MKYFVLGALSSGLLLYGLSMLYGATGSLELTRVAYAIEHGQAHTRLAVFGLVVNATGDLLTAVATGEPRTLIGVPVAGLIVWWLTRRDVRSRFS